MILSQPLADYLHFATDLAKEAGRITLKYFQTPLKIESKNDASPVTIADKIAEQFIRAQIQQHYPEHGLLGEEFGEVNAGSRLRWIVDPIDGTKAFIHGVPLYTVLLALEIDGESALGVIHCPFLDETVAAANGLGCSYNGAPCRVSDVSELADARVHTTDYAALMQTRPRFCERLLNQARFCRTWADGYGYLLVATGRADVMIDPHMNLWDSAALKPVITEAGGRYTDMDGNPTIHNPSALASNGRLHSALLALND